MGNEIKITEKDAKVFLVEWKKLVMESGLFPQYDFTDELNVRGILSKIKSFLRAEYELGNSWGDLKEDLKMVIDGWGRVPFRERKLSGISSKGKPYFVPMKAYPDFATYYDQRASVRQLCRKYSLYNKAKAVPNSKSEEELSKLRKMANPKYDF